MHTVPLWLIFIFVCAPCAHAYKGVCVFLFDYPTTKHHHTQTHTFHTSHKHTNTHPHRKAKKMNPLIPMGITVVALLAYTGLHPHRRNIYGNPVFVHTKEEIEVLKRKNIYWEISASIFLHSFRS